MNNYNTDKLKWNAYQFSDPFAIGQFYVFNVRTRRLCLPNCDVDLSELKSEVKFVSVNKTNQGNSPCGCDNTYEHNGCNQYTLVDIGSTATPTAGSVGSFIPCQSCNPLNFKLDIKTLILCVESTNRVINFRSSLPDLKLSKNDYDHYNLVNLACRHLAFAANLNYKNLNEKKKKRGGVLGFKELAVKSKLSPWHFHRVFKSITGLTPKNYGDKCWNFFKKFDEEEKLKNPKDRKDSYTQEIKLEAPQDLKIDYKLPNDVLPTNEELSRVSSIDSDLAIPSLEPIEKVEFTNNNIITPPNTTNKRIFDDQNLMYNQNLNYDYNLDQNFNLSNNFDFNYYTPANTSTNSKNFISYPSPLTSSNSEVEDSQPRKRVKFDNNINNFTNINTNNSTPIDLDLLLNPNHIRSLSESDLNLFNNQYFDKKDDFNDFDLNLIAIDDFNFS